LSTSSKIGVGIVGLSATRGWASLAHIPALDVVADFEIRALSASSPRSARDAAEKHGVGAPCASADELVHRDDVDLVVITVKVPDHFELVTAALRAGKAVFCEWPLGRNLQEAEELTALAARVGAPTFAGLQARSAPPIRYLRHLVDDGAVGTVLSTSVLASGLRWAQTIDSSRIYVLDRNNGATMLTIPFAHTIDGICHVLGQFSSVSATTAVQQPLVRLVETNEYLAKSAEDQIVVQGTLDGGAIASIHFRAGLSGGTNFLWEINGDRGDIVVRGANGHLQYGFISIEMSTNNQGLLPVAAPPSYRATPTDPSSYAHAVAEAYVQVAVDMRTGSRNAPSFHDALKRHQFLADVENSSASGLRTMCS